MCIRDSPEPEAQVAAPQPGMGPMDGFPGDPMHPDMGPGGPPMMEMPMGMPGDEGMAPGRPDLTGTRTYSFEDMVKPGFSLSEDSGYMVASGGVLYGFSAIAADNVKPEISDALLDAVSYTYLDVYKRQEMIPAHVEAERNTRSAAP